MITALTLAGAVPSFAEKKAPPVDESDLVSTVEADWKDAPETEGTSVTMIDASSGEILYDKDGDARRNPASITKIMTAILVLENLDMDHEVTVEEDTSSPGHAINMKKGEVLTVRDLMYAMLVLSANDAAEVLAVETAGSMEAFVDMMNSRAKEMGALDTHFINPNGMNGKGAGDHYTTARDISLMASEAMHDKRFRKMVATARYEIPATDLSGARSFENTNPCLVSYKGCTGIKTGSTSTAGYCFCGAAERNGTEIITVVLDSGEDSRFSESIKLWDYGFGKYRTQNVIEPGEAVDTVKVKRGDLREVDAGIAWGLGVTREKGSGDGDYRTETDMIYDSLDAPVKKGTLLGYVTVYDEEDRPVACEELRSLESAGKGGALSYIGIADEDRITFAMLVVIGIAAAIAISVTVRKRRERNIRRRKAQRKRNIRRRLWEKEKNPFDSEK